ncbi:MAG: CDP-diacylglycerol--glycerol-3-phosphate 3-phosphatidyltransferase [Peptococcaceae bacterium]|nr:CDP-diacylglycerol--glycerol-3-phosphate 3-phosphatidyltransferase [Peptococcaceae bacterium]
MCMVPLFMIALMMNTPASRLIATVIFALASLTDMLDGQIARKYNMVTNFGKLMDPLADKVLTAAAMICLVELGDLAAWIAVVIIFREYLITGLRSVAASENIVVAANIWGKVKTVCQMIALMLLMVKPQIVDLCGINIGLWLMYVAVALTIYSGLDYVLKLNKQITWN